MRVRFVPGAQFVFPPIYANIFVMDPEVKHLLEENLALSKENNELIKKVRNFQKWSRISRIFYWIIIIGVAYGAFYFLQPYIEKVMNLYSQLPKMPR